MKGVHPLESNTQSGHLPHNYEVVCRIPVLASSPEEAATAARDIMLDPDSALTVDVHAIEFYEPANDYMPNYDCGWFAHFGGVYYEPWPVEKRRYSVRPTDCVGYGHAPKAKD